MYTAIALRYPVRYRAEISAACENFGVSEQLAYGVIWTESKFRPQVTSAKGARGLMQIMPETGAYLAAKLGIDFEAEDLYIPAYNIRLGVYYLSLLSERFDTVYTLVAYNAGESRAALWQQSGTIEFAETRDYVQRVFHAQRVYAFRGIRQTSSDSVS